MMNSLYSQQYEDADTDVAVLNEKIRIEKVLDIRRQLSERRYNVAERLDVVIERLLDVLKP
jgi:hypothetical protein